MNTVIHALDRLMEHIASIVKYFIVLIILLILAEVASRLTLNLSYTWTREVAQWLNAGLILIGGAYAFLKGSFVRVDVFYGRMGQRAQALVDLTIGAVCVGLITYVLIRYGGKFALDSIRRFEVSTAAWQGPVWLAKTLLPVGGFLMLLAWLSHFLKCLRALVEPAEVAADDNDQRV